MTFLLDDSLRELGIKEIVVATVRGLDMTVALPVEYEEEIKDVEEKIKTLSLDVLEENVVLQGYVEMIKKIKRSKKKYPPTVEALIKNIKRREKMPRINSVVDLYNLESLHSYYSIGAHDLKKITFPVEFTVSKKETVFHPILSPEKKVMPFDYLYRDQKGVMAYLDCRDSEDYKLDDTTTEALFIIQGNAYTSIEDRTMALERLIHNLQRIMPTVTYTLEIVS